MLGAVSVLLGLQSLLLVFFKQIYVAQAGLKLNPLTQYVTDAPKC